MAEHNPLLRYLPSESCYLHIHKLAPHPLSRDLARNLAHWQACRQ